MTLVLLGNTLLRTAITRNLVSFPAQIQSFMRRSSGDLQERIVQLYFVRGWPVRKICERYGLSKAMAHKLLAEWRIRAVESGYVQEIEPETLEALIQHPGVQQADARQAGTQETNRDEDHFDMPIWQPATADHHMAARGSHEFDTKHSTRQPIPLVVPAAALSAGSGV